MDSVIAKLRRFGEDERGLALILVTVMLPVIIGFALLVIDFSRVTNLQNDTQKGADALAIAAAAELDGRADAWTRAQLALSTLVLNRTRFSDEDDGDGNAFYDITSSGTVTVSPGASACRSRGAISWCFLKTLPASDSTAIAASNYAANATETRFIRVTVTPQDFTTIFPASVTSMSIGSSAVAGFTSGVCDFTPVFICNPYENNPGGVSLQMAVADTALRRRLIELRKVGNGAATAGPGNFGFLEPPDGYGNGAQALAQMIASSRPRGCYSADGVTTKTGQNAGPVQDAFNVRFGIRANGNHFNSPEYGPATNVRKGGIRPSGNQNQCPTYNQLTFASPNLGLPRDGALAAGLEARRIGDGNWNLWGSDGSGSAAIACPAAYTATQCGYWRTNHPGRTPPSAWSTTKPTRYEVYKYEMDPNGDGNTSDSIVADVSRGTETGTPNSGCQPAIPPSTVDRRIIYGAILNCSTLEAAGYKLNGHAENLPVEAFGSFFLSEPVASASDDASVFVELVDVTGRAGQGTLDSFLRDEVQLYR